MAPISDDELAAMRLGDALRWASDRDGYLTSLELLERLARARGYAPGWAHHCYGEHWEGVWARCRRWQGERRARRK
jgi:hypothetical protein